ncbi:MAG TPA: Gfo/Idh/MocA family oxidoreductase [Methanoculleus sp.]|nr:Gfo/Idh/MocA family oxidoreductase [Methanoculleus sp.]
MDVGVIGVGMMGRNHARVYSELKGVDELWLFDLNAEAAGEVARSTGAVPADSMGELLRSVDAVSLCVPTPYHFASAKEVLGAGVHVLIEKPVCLTSQEGEQLIGLIPDDLVVGVGHIERFNPIVPEIVRILGDPLYVEMKRHNPFSSRVNGGSVVEDLMIHDIDIIFHALFSGPYTMDAACTFDVCGALFEFGKTPVYLSASRRASKKVRSVTIEMEEMTVEGNFMTQEVYVYRKPENYHVEAQRYVQENIIEKVMVGKVEPLRTELATFLDCVKSGRPFPVTPAQAVGNVRVCESIARQVHA